jgi:hypothetical protein
MIKEMINELNRAMYEEEISFDCARNLLEQLSKLTGKKYGILKRRVIIENADGTFNDAFVNS